MKVNELSPNTEIILEFEYKNLKKIPRNYGCYVISNQYCPK